MINGCPFLSHKTILVTHTMMGGALCSQCREEIWIKVVVVCANTSGGGKRGVVIINIAIASVHELHLVCWQMVSTLP